jgi:hypothetical protein
MALEVLVQRKVCFIMNAKKILKSIYFCIKILTEKQKFSNKLFLSLELNAKKIDSQILS